MVERAEREVKLVLDVNARWDALLHFDTLVLNSCRTRCFVGRFQRNHRSRHVVTLFTGNLQSPGKPETILPLAVPDTRGVKSKDAA